MINGQPTIDSTVSVKIVYSFAETANADWHFVYREEIYRAFESRGEKKGKSQVKKETAHNGIILTEKGAKLSLLKGLIIDSLNLKLSINNATPGPNKINKKRKKGLKQKRKNEKTRRTKSRGSDLSSNVW